MKGFRRIGRWALVLIIISALSGSLAGGLNRLHAQEYGGIVLLIAAVDEVNCNMEMKLEAGITNSLEQPITFRTRITVGGTVYVDNLMIEDHYPEITAVGVFPIIYDNTGGTATGTLPIPSGQPMYVTTQLLSDNITPLWEISYVITDCNGGTMSGFPIAGEVNNLVMNTGFERAGTDEKLPAHWTVKGSKTRRICNTPLVITSYSGDCAYQFKAAAVKTSIQQVAALEPIAMSGDRLDLKTWVKAQELTAGSQVKMVVKYPTLPKQKVIIDIPPGSYGYTLLSAPSVIVTEEPTRVKVSVQAKGQGTFVIDNVLAQRVLNGSYILTTRGPIEAAVLPLPGAEPAKMDITRPQ